MHPEINATAATRPENAIARHDLLAPPSSQLSSQLPSSSDSRDTNTDSVFTPTPSQEINSSFTNARPDSQDSQLLQLSTLAAAQEKMGEPASPAGTSRKRTADGVVKHAREHSSTSPVYATASRHSRNTSTVSMASTASSHLGEVSAELKARLKYAMVKVNHGWQSRSIDEVENLASQAASSPTSSNSTLHGRHGSSSASPRLQYSASQPAPHSAPHDASWKNSPSSQPSASPPPTASSHVTLAPPAAIHASRGSTDARRNSRTKYTPSYLSHTQHASSPSGTPTTPGQPSPMQSTPGQRSLGTPVVDPILFSPAQHAREQEAIESLLFMGSPGNTATLKNTFSPQVAPPRNGAPRTALPTSRLAQSHEASTQRKSLPAGRPQPQYPHKRVVFEKSPINAGDGEIDESLTSPRAAGKSTPRRKTAGNAAARTLSVSSGLSGPNRPLRKLGEADFERMFERAGDGDSSDSESELQIPVRPTRGAVGA